MEDERMIISLKQDVRKEEMDHLISWLETYDVAPMCP